MGALAPAGSRLTRGNARVCEEKATNGAEGTPVNILVLTHSHIRRRSKSKGRGRRNNINSKRGVWFGEIDKERRIPPPYISEQFLPLYYVHDNNYLISSCHVL